MHIDLAGKNAIVTGGASGIGRATALALSHAGARVAVIDIKPFEEEHGAANTGIASFVCDLADEAAIVSTRDAVLAAMQGVDIVVNCAGLISYRSGVGAVNADEWDRVMKVNLRGTFLVCQAFFDSLKSRRNGRIVTCSSLAARVGGIEVGVDYTASKAGLIGLTRSLAKEGGEYGITANAVAPGIVQTGPVKQQIAGKESNYVDNIPLRRLGEPEDIANTIVFLVSPQASYISGVVLDINGGMYMA